MPATDDDVLQLIRDVAISTIGIAAESEVDPTALLLDVSRDSTAVRCLLSRLFPSGTPTDSRFFRRLDEIQNRLGYPHNVSEAIANIWADALTHLNASDQKALLSTFATSKSHDFFALSNALPPLITALRLPADFLAEWITDLVCAVERDLAQEPVWAAIATLCEHQPSMAIDVLWSLTTLPEPRQLAIVAFILGKLRTLKNASLTPATVATAESFFRESQIPQFRTTYIQSWYATARAASPTADTLRPVIQLAARFDEDRSAVIILLCRLIGSGLVECDVFVQCADWLSNNISTSRSPEANYELARLAVLCTCEHPRLKCGARHSLLWLVDIQPVSVSDLGTWRQIEETLANVLSSSRATFDGLLIQLFDRCAEQLRELLSTQSLRRLPRTLAEANVIEAVSVLCVSLNRDKRRLGFYLFDSLTLDRLSPRVLTADSGRLCRVVFYEAQRSTLTPRVLARLLVAVASVEPSLPKEFRDEVADELRLQCLNFAGSFREELRPFAQKCELVAEALQYAEEYFEDYEAVRNSGIAEMGVPGYSRAVALHGRLLARRVNESVKKHSVIMSLVRTITIPYGAGSSDFANDTLGTTRSFVPMSHSVELPIIELSDPEHMATRRLLASARLRELETGVESKTQEGEQGE